MLTINYTSKRLEEDGLSDAECIEEASLIADSNLFEEDSELSYSNALVLTALVCEVLEGKIPRDKIRFKIDGVVHEIDDLGFFSPDVEFPWVSTVRRLNITRQRILEL